MKRDLHSLVEFWFGNVQDTPAYAQERMKMWFSPPEGFDEQIRTTYYAWLKDLENKELGFWLESPRGCQAWILLTDQIPRNAFRGQAESFRYDEMSRAVANFVIKQGWDKEFTLMERIFLYLPFEHSENIEDQDTSVRLFTELLEEVPENLRNTFQSTLDYAIKHRELIQRFGRFPHRNKILGRESTPEELAFIKEFGVGF